MERGARCRSAASRTASPSACASSATRSRRASRSRAALVSWLTQIAGIYWTLDAFGIRKGVSAAALVFLVSTLVQLFPIIPGNIGSFQLAVAYPLAQTYNIDTGRAIAFSIGLQVIEAALATGLGFIFLSREGLSLAEARRLPCTRVRCLSFDRGPGTNFNAYRSNLLKVYCALPK